MLKTPVNVEERRTEEFVEFYDIILDADGKEICVTNLAKGYNSLASANEKLAARVAELENDLQAIGECKLSDSGIDCEDCEEKYGPCVSIKLQKIHNTKKED